ncbi:hypothetical protein ADIS_4072 [Lunatimonas lonarensis]|uniref:Gingipain domain-containing protein n=1 Tax=Lunatimonas lonarensis TaxID=1232681 RepID=R7ZMQ1_9BACT|nr:C25 family cysteine peptidase [Lunatimonas lonarensis]EON75368.1 hypothetical protein ADIS_4072 [Lunatimonas lonarensis]
MKKVFFTAILTWWIGAVFGQNNQWINYSQDYYKIPTAANSIYRLSYTTLAASGINMNTLDPRDIRIYHRGQEVAIQLDGQQDGRFDTGDFIQFMGKKNDASLDLALYSDPNHLPNPYYNTHNDTTAFFLTVTPGVRGKRMQVKEAPTNQVPLTSSYIREELVDFSEQYFLGRSYFPGVRLSKYDQGQGWTGTNLARGANRVINLNNLGSLSPLVVPSLEISLLGRSETPHRTAIQVGPSLSALRGLGTYDYQNFEVNVLSEPLQATDFSSDGNLVVRVASMGVDGAIDNISINYIKVTLGVVIPAGDVNQRRMQFPSGISRLSIQNTSQNYLVYDVSDSYHVVRHEVRRTGNLLETIAGDPGRPATLHLQQTSTVIEPNVLERVRFRNLLAQNADYLIISHRKLTQPSSTYGNPVEAYAAHRAGPAGGGYDTLTVTMEQLYNQFSYGEKSPLAIREFLKTYFPIHQPDHLLLIGRAFGIYNTQRSGGVSYFYRNNPAIFPIQDLVPVFGYPYSDNQYALGLDPAFPLRQDIAVGRLPARTPEDVANYLEKIKEKDALGVQEPWQKNLIHLSGGRSAFELERFYNFLSGFRATAEDIYLGGSVFTFRKRSNATVELINISEQVNAGVSLVTFFGHAAPSSTDIDIGFAGIDEMGYRNKGKYPVLLLNGCDAGNAFGAAYTFGEDWINTPDRGASNFLAHSDVGIDVYLRRYSESFYAKAFSDSSLIYQSVGKVKIESDKLLYERYGTSEVNQSHANQMIMLGDPAARIFPANKADYSLNAEEVWLEGFNGDPLSSLLDSVKLSVVVRNLGIVNLDSIEINVSRQLPDGTTVAYDTRQFEPIFRKDTLSLSISNTGVNAFGDNHFTIEVNKRRPIQELTFANNTVMVSKYIPMSGTLNLFPIDFAIVNSRNVEIIAQIPGKSVEERTIVVQLDTAANFSSAWRRETRITTSNLARWQVDLFQQIPQRDSLTYYWRTRFLEPKPGENAAWTPTSFSYIRNGPEGWTQRELPQFEGSRLQNIQIDRQSSSWRFEDKQLAIDLFTFGPEMEGMDPTNIQLLINGVSYILDQAGRLCFPGSLGLLAFQDKTLNPYLPIPLTTAEILDPKACGRSPQIIQNIRNQWITGAGQTMLLDYINNLAPDDYVVIFSIGNVTFSDWSDEVIMKMKEVGANEATIRNLRTGDPYVLFGRKGMRPGDAIELVPNDEKEEPASAQSLRFETVLKGFSPFASITSPLIGPSSHWVSFFNRVLERDYFNTSLSHFDLVGITPEGGEVTLYPHLQTTQLDLNSINPTDYPYLRLKYAMEDPDALVPEHLDKWQVNYTGVPEGVLILKTRQDQINLFEGQESEVAFEFVNISKFDFPDSLTVEYSFYNVDQRRTERFTMKIPAVKGGQSHAFSLPFDSRGKAGKNAVNVSVNPRIFMEQRFRNNLMDLPDYFIVAGDDLNPILDVHFDGIYIMDGDIVSPTVLISTVVKDENRFSLKKDTVGIELMLKKPCEGCDFQRISFSNPQVRWFEATENSEFKIEFQPGPLEDGLYVLRVNASDVAGNMAGEKPYEINFEVVNESQITNFYPYPNPFSSSVRFVFTVTGSEVPDEIKIQIMTVTGKIVREIFQDELGPIRIGNNISEFAWDGKDEYGDQLANGVYIYRVLVRKNGQFMEHRATAGDKAFKRGYGKMYLLR